MDYIDSSDELSEYEEGPRTNDEDYEDDSDIIHSDDLPIDDMQFNDHLDTEEEPSDDEAIIYPNIKRRRFDVDESEKDEEEVAGIIIVSVKKRDRHRNVRSEEKEDSEEEEDEEEQEGTKGDRHRYVRSEEKEDEEEE